MSNQVDDIFAENINSLRKDITELTAQVAVLKSKLEDKSGNGDETGKHVVSIFGQISKIQRDVEELRKDFDEHRNAVPASIEQLKKDSFPNGDPTGHKSFHENEMEKRKGFAEIKKDVISHITKGAFWAVVVAIFWACALALKEWMKK